MTNEPNEAPVAGAAADPNAQSAAPASDPSSAFDFNTVADQSITVPGLNRDMTLGQLRDGMHSAHVTASQSLERVADLERQVQQHETFQNDYNTWYSTYGQQPQVATPEADAYGQTYQAPAAALAPDPALQQVMQEIAVLKNDAASRDQRAALDQIRSGGNLLTPEMELDILQKVADPNQPVRDVEALYHKDYHAVNYDHKLKNALSGQANEIANTQGNYQQMPSSIPAPPSPIDVASMSDSDWESAAVAELKRMGG